MIKIIYSNTTKCQIQHLKSSLAKKEELFEPDVVICEDRFTLSLEQEILGAKDGFGSFSVNVYSFSRLLHQLLKNQKPQNYLTKTGGVMMLSKILLEESKNLKCYADVAKNYSTLSMSIFDVIAQLKSSMVEYSDLEKATPKSPALSLKTRDLALIYRKYEEMKSNVLLDSADKVELLNDLAGQVESVKETAFHILGFTSFTKQFYKVIGTLANRSKDINIYILDGENDVYDKSVKKNILKMLDDLGLEYKEERIFEKLDIVRDNLSKYLFSFTPKNKIYPVETDNIAIFQGSTLTDEIKFISEKILEHVRIEGKRFDDIGVIGANLADNQMIIAREFAKYDIPIFLDNKVQLSKHVLARTIIAMMSLSVDGFKTENVLTIIHSPFCNLSEDDKCDFENYLVARGVSQRNFMKDSIYKDEKMLEIRNMFLKEFMMHLKSVADVSSFCKEVRFVLEKFSSQMENIAKQFEKVGEMEHAAMTLQGTAKFLETIDELENIMKGTVLTVDDFMKILMDGLVAKEIALVPLYSDSVFVGDFSSSKFAQKDILFALSVNNKIVPMVKNDVGLISDKDIDGLLPCEINLEPKIEMINDRERLNVYTALLNFKEKLYLTYSNYATNNDKLLPSEIIAIAESCFLHNGVNITPIETSAVDFSNTNQLTSYVEKRVLTKKLALSKLAESVSLIKIGEENKNQLASTIFSSLKETDCNKLAENIATEVPQQLVKNAFDKKTMYSVSNLESYFSCPYKNFVQNGLLAKPRAEGVIKAMDSGNYLHKALELFVNDIEKVNINNFKPFAIECVKSVRESEQFSRYEYLPRYANAMDRLDLEFLNVAKEVTLRKETSDFLPVGTEIKFGVGEKISALDLGNGVKIRGVVDYVDKYKEYLRVIDYKTGKVDSNYKDVFLGQKFQPYLYLEVMTKHFEKVEAGALYFPIKPTYEAEEENIAPYRMKGVVTSNMDAISAMDKTLNEDKLKSDVIPVTLTSKMQPHKGQSKTLGSDEFSSFLNYSKMISAKAIKEIRMGNVSPSPYESACEFCDYLAICQYDVSYQGERKCGGTLKSDTIVSAVKGELGE